MQHLKIQDNKGTGDDFIEVTLQQDGEFEFKVSNPWAGGSETGLGIDAMIWLTKEQAIELRDFLNRVLG